MKHYLVKSGFSARDFVGNEGDVVSHQTLLDDAKLDKDQIASLVGMGRLEEAEAPAAAKDTKAKKAAASLPGT